MYLYEQSTGKLRDENGVLIGEGYSGHAEGKNNPQMQNVPDIGPIPVGVYRIGQPFDHPHLGPCVMSLTPLPETDTFGRSGFFLHGDDREHPGEGSEGCIVQGPMVRHAVAATVSTGIGDGLLKVVADYGDGNGTLSS